jgi:DNA ligase-1
VELEALFEQALTEDCEGLLCTLLAREAGYQVGGWGGGGVGQALREYRTEDSDIVDLVVMGTLAGRGRRRRAPIVLLSTHRDPDPCRAPRSRSVVAPAAMVG